MVRTLATLAVALTVGSVVGQPPAKPVVYDPFPKDLPQKFQAAMKANAASYSEGVTFGYFHQLPVGAFTPMLESFGGVQPDRTALPGLRNEDFNEKMFKAFPKVPKPFGAVLQKDKLLDGPLAYLAKQDQLVLLDVTFKESSAAEATWAAVAKLPRLRHLKIRVQGEAADAPTAAVLRAFAKAGLTTLDLAHVKVGPETVKAVADLKSLTALTVYGTEAFDDAAMTAILPALPNLQKLRFGETKITHAVARPLATHPALEEILGDGGFCRAADLPLFAASPKLRVLQLGSVSQSGADRYERWSDEAVIALAKAKALEALELNDCDALTDAGYRSLFGIPTLTRLKLGRALKLDAAGLPLLAASKLESVELSVTENLDPDGWKALAGLPKLREFRLDLGKSLTDADADAFTQAKGLEVLSFGNCKQLTAAALKNVDKLRALKHLHLTSMDDPELDDAALAKVATLPKLEHLSVRTSKAATDAGLRSVSKLKTLKHLTVYANKESKMTREGKAAVRTALPNCYVFITD